MFSLIRKRLLFAYKNNCLVNNVITDSRSMFYVKLKSITVRRLSEIMRIYVYGQ